MNVFQVLTDANRVETIPIPDISEVTMDRSALSITTRRGSVIKANPEFWIPPIDQQQSLHEKYAVGTFIYGELASIKRGSGALWRTPGDPLPNEPGRRFKQEILVKPGASARRLVLSPIDPGAE